MATALGPLAQLVERHAYTVDVIGSSPVGPTKVEKATIFGCLFCVFISALLA